MSLLLLWVFTVDHFFFGYKDGGGEKKDTSYLGLFFLLDPFSPDQLDYQEAPMLFGVSLPKQEWLPAPIPTSMTVRRGYVVTGEEGFQSFGGRMR